MKITPNCSVQQSVILEKGHRAKFIDAMLIRRVRKSVRYDVLKKGCIYCIEALKYHNHGQLKATLRSILALKQRCLELNVTQIQYL